MAVSSVARSAHFVRIPSAAARSAASSSSFRSSSTISVTPPGESLTGTPTYTPSIPYWPVHHAQTGSGSSTRPAIASTILAAEAEGA